MQYSTFSLHLFSLIMLSMLLMSCPSQGTSASPPSKGPSGPSTTGTVVETTPPPYFLFLADIHLNTNRANTPYKDDTGTDLWSAAKDRLNTLVTQSNPPKFIIYTGDLTAHEYQHSGETLSLGERQNNSKVVLTDLKHIAGSIPLFYAPGNNDGIDGDYYPFTNPEDSTVLDLTPNLNYPAPNATMVSDQHPKDGYYSARPFDNLRIIALNSVILGFKHDGPAPHAPYHASGDTMLTWLGAELADVRAKKEKAYIMMHIPPGIDAHSGNYLWDTQQNNEWQSQFLRIVDTFQHEIAGVLYGHTHMEELRQLARHSDPSIINEVAISSPGISPNHGQNPAFKTVTYEAKTFELHDFITYYTDKDDLVWGPDSLRFSLVYNCQGKPIYDCLKNRDVNSIATDMVNNKYNMYKTGRKGTTVDDVISGILVN